MNGKRSAFLALLLCICLLASSTLAAQGILEERENHRTYVSYRSLAAVGDSLWMLRDGRDVQLFRMDLNTLEKTEYTHAADGKKLLFNHWLISSEDEAQAEGIDFKHLLSLLLTDGEKLYGINLNSGLIMLLRDQNGTIAFEELGALSDQSLLYHPDSGSNPLLHNLNFAFAHQGQLYFSATDFVGNQEERSCCRVDPETGAVTKLKSKNLMALCPYKDGKLAAMVQDPDKVWDADTGKRLPCALGLYDPNTDTFEQKKTYVAPDFQMAYSAAADRLLFVDGGRIMGLRDWQDEKQVGYLPASSPSVLTVTADGSLICADNGDLKAGKLDENFRGDQKLVIANAFNLAVNAFIREHPNAAVYQNSDYISSLDEIRAAVTSGDDAFDIIRLSPAYHPFGALADKGYCLDLSAYPALMERVNHLYPVFRDLVLRDGKLYGVPIDMNIETLACFRDTMQEQGLTEADLPASLIGLIDFLNDWEADFDSHSELPALGIYSGTLRGTVLKRLLVAYEDLCNLRGEELRFDTPLFRQLMQAWTKMNTPRQERLLKGDTESEVSVQTMLSEYFDLMNSGSSPWSPSSWMIHLLLPLTPDSELALGTNVDVLAVNPKTANPDLAAECLLSVLNHLDPVVQAEMFDDRAMPVENSYYAENAAQQKKYIKDLEDQLAAATDEGEKKNLQDSIESMRSFLERMEREDRYQLSPTDIEKYQSDVLPHIVLRTDRQLINGQLSEDVGTLVQRAADGQISPDRLIQELDQKLRMFRMENQ